ncbi:MAG: response regulator [Pirellulales bacterium]
MRLPTAQPPASAPELAPSKSPGEPTGSLRVLVVDDNKDAANSLAMLLRQGGYDVQVAFSGAAALAMATEFLPDAVLLDLGMPELDGYEVARLMRKKRTLKNVRLVALTGYGRDDDRQRSQEAGFDAHLVKPVEIQKLRELLAGLTIQRPGP